MARPVDLRLIVITDRDIAAPRDTYDIVAACLAAGTPAIQLRDKHATTRELYEQAVVLRALTRRYGALLFVNDRLDVALAADADGVHLGPHDLPIADARRVVPAGFLIGASADEPDVARRLQGDGADYIGCGTVFPTTTKTDAGSDIGPEGLDRVARAVHVPVVGIGGITVERAPALARTAAAGIAVVGAVMEAEDPATVVRCLLEYFEEGESRRVRRGGSGEGSEWRRVSRGE
ncbi:MAG: thiamine phosphate synthase [Gemmatimonadota bacterium]